MTIGRATVFLVGVSALALAAVAQTAAPDKRPAPTFRGTVQSPLDGSLSTEILINGERRPSAAHVLSVRDHDLFTRAFDAADRGDWTAARNLSAEGHDFIATRLVTWRYVLDKNSGASFADIDAFLRNSPDWPLRNAIFARAELAMDAGFAPSSVLAWFGDRTPVTGLGMIRLGDAMIAVGQVTAGREMVRRGWMSGNFEPDQERAIIQEDGNLLTPDIDRTRLSNLISRDDIAGAKRELSRVDDDVRQLGEARLALRNDRAAGEKLVARLPKSVASDPELLFDRARAARRAADYETAAIHLGRGTLKGFAQSYPTRWWTEANLVSRALLNNGDNRGAYAIVSDSGLSSGLEFNEAEFMAGWIALRFLKSPSLGLVHFSKLEAGVSRPISLARARYWKARCYEASGDMPNARAQYKLAAQAPDTFYGQLALSRIEVSPVLHLNDVQIDASDAKNEFDTDELVRAMRVLAELGQQNILRLFAVRDQELNPGAKHVKMLAQTMFDLGFREIAVRIGKATGYAGVPMLTYAYPIIALPAYSADGPAPAPELILGLIRQETEFDADSVSRAGARGLMQLMPASARADAVRAHLPWRPNALASDSSYNIQLGMAEFQGYVNRWNGSLVLAIASYNAGQGNVKKWLAANGDPRNPVTDPIDWIESIPFGETRNYVMRVLENAQIYRNRLSGHDQPLGILADLYAPLPPAMKPISPPSQ